MSNIDTSTENNQSTQDYLKVTEDHLDYMIKRLGWFETLWIIIGLISIVVTVYFANNSYFDTKGYINLGANEIQSQDIGKIKDVKKTDNNQKEKYTDNFLHYILLIKGILLTTIPAALATYSFKVSRSYIHERLKRQERKHAINFGRFYLDRFDVEDLNEHNLTPKELLDIFQWNIINESAFIKSGYNKIESSPYLDIIKALKEFKG